MSARVHTKDSFAFRYGKVQIRARLPVGDWIVPEIWLQPKDYEYGPDYASGRIRIALARGNRQLKVGDWDIGGDTVESGILVGLGEQVQGRVVEWKIPDGEQRKFHNFTLIWTPDNLSFSVDDLEPLKLLGPDQQKLSQLLSFEEPLADTWKNGTAIAPFDQEFYISLGVSVGGVRDFPDNSTSGSYAKPWENMQFKVSSFFFW
ncbi:hypothetical protein AAG570_002528 [Ranatra chinensis]|uniref:GH16 domain-containing protein n=1 Tax=Ranatra chinensis TaxID=642074 RepID=A0ABD0YQJ2_9HEMI